MDVAIIEVGVGGEYDSTNILPSPVACGITSLGLDHIGTLGANLESIAWHKAGIMKVIPVLSSKAVLPLIEECQFLLPSPLPPPLSLFACG